MQFSQAFHPFRALGAAWRAIQAAPLAMIVGGVLLTLTSGGGSGGGGLSEDGSGWGGSLDTGHALLIVALVVLALGIALAFWLFGCLVRVGFAGAMESVLATGEARLGQVFEPRGLWLKMVLVTLLRALLSFLVTLPLLAVMLVPLFLRGAGNSDAFSIGLLVGIGAIVLIAAPVWIYVLLGLSLMPEATAIEGLGPRDALRRSWSLVAGNRLQLLLYVVVLAVFTLLGLLACCVGVLFTGAISHIANYESYLRLVRSEEEQLGWALASQSESRIDS